MNLNVIELVTGVIVVADIEELDGPIKLIPLDIGFYIASSYIKLSLIHI